MNNTVFYKGAYMALSGNEVFKSGDQDTGLSILDVWRYHNPNLYFQHGNIGEFLVASALGQKVTRDQDYWALCDVEYRGRRIEVKTTAYYQKKKKKWGISKARSFGIAPANSAYETENRKENRYERQNDIYVFCLNTGNTREESNPLQLLNWEFYVVPTAKINQVCGRKQKTISLGRVRKLAGMCRYEQIKENVDRIIDQTEEIENGTV